MEANCKNCATVISGKYCSNCGYQQHLKRIDRSYIFDEILSLVGLEKGFVNTGKELLLRPGITIRQYLNEDRQKIIKPITYLAVTSIIYTLLLQYGQIENQSQIPNEISVFNKVISWTEENMAYTNLLITLPISLWCFLFFRKYKYNFYETFMVCCYTVGTATMISSLSPILNYFSVQTRALNDSLGSVPEFIYLSWAIGESYEKKLINYVKGFLVYLFGLLTSIILLVGIVIMIDSIVKN